MKIYPVLDLKGGVVVRGSGGDRANYRPVESCLVDSADPLAVARAFRERLSLDHLYIADLDALGGASPASETIQALRVDGFRLLLDAGIRSASDAVSLLESGVHEVVAALETLPDPASLEDVLRAAGAERVVFSLDLKAGRLLGNVSGWPFAGPLEVASEARRRGARRILLLDLAQVGSRRGPAHLRLLEELVRALPDVELLSGGGVRCLDDLLLLEKAGVRGVLVASAFHDGVITSRDVGELLKA